MMLVKNNPLKRIGAPEQVVSAYSPKIYGEMQFLAGTTHGGRTWTGALERSIALSLNVNPATGVASPVNPYGGDPFDTLQSLISWLATADLSVATSVTVTLTDITHTYTPGSTTIYSQGPVNILIKSTTTTATISGATGASRALNIIGASVTFQNIAFTNIAITASAGANVTFTGCTISAYSSADAALTVTDSSVCTINTSCTIGSGTVIVNQCSVLNCNPAITVSNGGIYVTQKSSAVFLSNVTSTTNDSVPAILSYQGSSVVVSGNLVTSGANSGSFDNIVSGFSSGLTVNGSITLDGLLKCEKNSNVDISGSVSGSSQRGIYVAYGSSIQIGGDCSVSNTATGSGIIEHGSSAVIGGVCSFISNVSGHNGLLVRYGSSFAATATSASHTFRNNNASGSHGINVSFGSFMAAQNTSGGTTTVATANSGGRAILSAHNSYFNGENGSFTVAASTSKSIAATYGSYVNLLSASVAGTPVYTPAADANDPYSLVRA